MQAVFVCLVLLCRLCVAGCADDVESTLQKLSQITNTDAGEWRFQHPAQPGGEAVGLDDSSWATVRPEHRWEGPQTEAWYRRQFVIPPQVGGVDITGTRLTLRFAVDDDAEVYVNGQSRGTFHWDQGEVVLTESAQPGETVLVALRAINGPVYGRLMSASAGLQAVRARAREIEAHRDGWRSVVGCWTRPRGGAGRVPAALEGGAGAGSRARRYRRDGSGLSRRSRAWPAVGLAKRTRCTSWGMRTST